MSTDEEMIRNLLGRHAQLTDDGEVAERVKLYLDDGVFQMGDRRSTGHQEIEAAFSVSAGVKGGKHITANMVIDVRSEKASVQTDFTFLRATAEGVVIVAVGRYYDSLEKHQGGWMIRERRIVPLAAPA
jgi:3-phenylpropionate/cinnamic acid dioxygenase small subunit